MYFKLAWRNIWRNKRRTFITMASIFFALLFALVMRSMQIGSYDAMVNNVVQSYTGYIQIHSNGYWDNKIINNTFESSNTLIEKVLSANNVNFVIPRLESFALASAEQITKGVVVIGIEPDKENQLSKISDKIIKGDYLSNDDDGVLLAEKLAGYLKLSVNDTLVLLGQGFHGVSAAGKYPVKGIIHFPAPELNNQLVYMTLANCQEFYTAENRLTSLALMIKNNNTIDKTVNEIKNIINNDLYEVMSWDEMLIELVQLIEQDNAGGLIFLGILYIIVAFGIFGTVLMMTAERKREFGVIVAVGMQKTKLAIIVTIESIFIGLTGIIIGIIGSLPIIYYYFLHPIKLTGDLAISMENYGFEPIMPFAWETSFFFNQSLVVILITLIAIIYPISTILKMKVIKALRN